MLPQLLVDCEGIDAVDQGQQHSAQIFSLAVLLSSVFVYNQLGAIDAVALERLAMVRRGRGGGVPCCVPHTHRAAHTPLSVPGA